MTVEQVLEEAERERVFYEASRGGITVSGGEPFAQPVFLGAFLKACKARGMATAIETAGSASWDILEPIIPYADCILYDIKHIKSSRHGQLTGVSNKRVLENARRMAGLGLPLAIRYAVIPGFNGGREDREALFRFANTLPGNAADVIAEQMGPGQYFGEMEFMHGQTRSASVRASEHGGTVEVLSLGYDTLADLLESSEAARQQFQQVADERKVHNIELRGGA